MPSFLGLDTSNYTTSAAVYCTETATVTHVKRLLPVKEGQLGLRQSDAVFHHVQQLPLLMDKLMKDQEMLPAAVGASVRPRDTAGSYMPCFTVGAGAARVLSSVLKVPFYGFSHQAGHIAAALYSAGRLELLDESFLAFHVSGGTTEAVLVQPDKASTISAQVVAKTLDLNAGQAVDRVGGLLGLPFPAGARLEKLALAWKEPISVKPTLKGCDCCLSGVENLCRSMVQRGEPKEKVAAFCLEYIAQTLGRMYECLAAAYGELPVLFAGGVMSNSIIRKRFIERYGAIFAQPEFSADNAAGIAVLTARKAGVLH